MKTLTFTQHLTAYREVTIIIKDEELFRQKCEEWVKTEGSLNHWDMEESFFEGSAEIDYSDIDWSEEDNDNFYDLMESENIEFVD
jgi:hypothetical protein